MVLSGPTGVGAAYLVDSYAAGSAPTDAPFTLNTTVVADNNQVTDALVNGSADVAAIATNVAANLYTKSDGAIQVLAVNTLGVLYILEKGDSVHSMADLRGKTIYATGQGANPEYVLDHLLTANGVDPSTLDIQWMTAQEVSAKMVSSEQAICMLPVPAHPNHPGYTSGFLYPAGPAMDAAGPGTCHHLRPYGSAGYVGEPGPRHRGH